MLSGRQLLTGMDSETGIVLSTLKCLDSMVILLGNWSEATSSSLNTIFYLDAARTLKAKNVLQPENFKPAELHIMNLSSWPAGIPVKVKILQ